MSSTRIRAIVVDDEELARRGIELRLRNHPDIELVAQCTNGREALNTIDSTQPDLMFLDIQMPGLSGFDVLARVPHESMPMIVFVTAYDRYALDAFEAQALDYLLKPINDTRFTQALDRVREQWAQRNALVQREKLMSLLAATRDLDSEMGPFRFLYSTEEDQRCVGRDAHRGRVNVEGDAVRNHMPASRERHRKDHLMANGTELEGPACKAQSLRGRTRTNLALIAHQLRDACRQNWEEVGDP